MDLTPEHANSDYDNPWNLRSGSQPASYCFLQRSARESMLASLNVDEYEFLYVNDRWFIIPKGNNRIWESSKKETLLGFIGTLTEHINATIQN